MNSISKRLTNSVAGVLLIVFSVLTTFATPLQAAADARFFLTPSSATLEQGDKISYSVKIDTGSDSIDSFQAVITYDTSKLSFQSVSANTAKFPFIVEESNSSGKVTVIAGSASQVDGSSVLAATLVMKAKVGSGSTSVSFKKSESTAAKIGEDRLGSTSSASISFKTDAPPPDPDPDPEPTPDPDPSPTPDPGSSGSGSSGSSSSSNNSSSSSSSGGKDVTPPAVKSQGMSSVGFNTATAFLNTDEKTKASLRIGLSEDDLRAAIQSKKFSRTHSFSISRNYLAPGNTFFYQLVFEDQEGNRTKGEVMSFTTKGYPVRIQLKDLNDEPVANWDVTLFSEPLTAKTDDEGTAVIENVAPGTHTIQVQVRGETYTKEVKVKDTLKSTKKSINKNASPEAQVFNFAVAQDFPTDLSILNTIIYGVLALIGLLILLLFLRRISLWVRSRGTAGVVISADNDAAMNMQIPQPTQVPPNPTVTPQGQPHEAGSVYMPGANQAQPPAQPPIQPQQPPAQPPQQPPTIVQPQVPPPSNQPPVQPQQQPPVPPDQNQ